jgi:putative ABC transport system substrate-binding protein
MMNRRIFVRSVAGSVLAVPLAALAQPKAAIRIGWLAFLPIASNLATFRRTMKEFGYVEGENLVIEERYAVRPERYAEVTAELVRLKVDVIVTTGTQASLEAKKATATIPIVFVSSLVVTRGLVASLARPGGNLTGVELTSGDFDAKRVQLLKDAVPGLVNLAGLNDVSGQQGSASTQRYWQQSEVAARQLGIRLGQRLDVRTIDDVDRAFAAAAKASAGAMLTPSSSFFHAHKERVVNAAARSRLPTIYEHGDFVEAGGLMSYGSDLREVFRGAAVLVDKVLKGAKPANLPVEQATRIVLAINIKAAKALGLTIPQSLLLRADEVIQ